MLRSHYALLSKFSAVIKSQSSVNLKCRNLSLTSLKFLSAKPQDEQKEIVSSKYESADISTHVMTVKETTKTVSYGGIMLLGIGVTGALFYAIFSELFSGKSTNGVYSKALDRCINDDRIKMSLGEPISGYGEETRRGRRRHVSHLLYSKDGVDHLRMKFYLKGIRRRATVHLEVKENASGKYEYRYLFAQLDDYPNTTYILEDNREKNQVAPIGQMEQLPTFS